MLPASDQQPNAGVRIVVTFFHPEGYPLLVDTIYLRPPSPLPLKAQAEDPHDVDGDGDAGGR
jgi:hypothetical protein